MAYVINQGNIFGIDFLFDLRTKLAQLVEKEKSPSFKTKGENIRSVDKKTISQTDQAPINFCALVAGKGPSQALMVEMGPDPTRIYF